MTLDYFNIAVDDRISISDQQDFVAALQITAVDNGIPITGDETTSQLLNLLDGAGVLNAADFAGAEDLTSFGYFSNAYDTETQGIDLVVNTGWEMWGGDTSMAVAFNWTDTEVTRGTLVDGTGSLSFTRQRQLEENIPSVRGSVTLNHSQGSWRGLARLNYFGSMFECHLDAVGDDAVGTCDLPLDVSSEVTVDLEGAYNFNDNWEIVLGARNAFDSFPDKNVWAGVAGATYPPTAPNGFTGGSYYLKVKADF